jgi:hypothetical protein
MTPGIAMSIWTTRAERIRWHCRRPEADGNDANAQHNREDSLHVLFL